ncbi:hypothetical protein DY000_02042492 [Brassica cretica]|uniref:Uncharacterized protein n=1 Tax=Brassica cretica TaxID=69181 RepID=A0ABQ7BLA7_BRACR|nr:hypothetical protein DY000_02042492 [Brassica cretica]
MASQWWDPGDLGVCGEFSSREGFGLAGWKVVLILRWFGLKRDKGIREGLRNHGILRDLLAILILIKTVSQSMEGNMSGDCQSTDFGFLMEIGGINYRLVSIKAEDAAALSVGDHLLGKMFEEQESKWVKVPKRGNKKNSNYRGNYRGDCGVSRSRGARREESRAWEQEGHSTFSSGQAKEHHEEGEIMDTRVAAAALPSQQFQLELAETQARGTVVISDPIDTEKGLQALQGLGEGKPDHVDDDYVMGMDEVKAAFLEYGIDMNVADDLEDVTEVEMEELFLDKESVAPLVETEARGEVETERGPVTGEVAKQQGTRKRTFKPTGSAAGSTKMRIANGLVKRAAAKASSRQGDGRKQQESKGTSIPKPGNFKDWWDMLHYFALKFVSEIFLCIWMCGDLNGCLGIEWYSSRLAEMVLVLNGMVRKIILLLSMYVDCGGWRDGLGIRLRSLKLRLVVWSWVNEISNILVQDGGFVGSDGVVYYGGGIIVTLAQDHLALASGLQKMEMVAQSATSHASESMTDRPPDVKSAKANGKKGKAEESLSEYTGMWSIRKEDMAIKERLAKMKFLDRLLAKVEPLDESEETLKKKLINELVPLSREVKEWSRGSEGVESQECLVVGILFHIQVNTSSNRWPCESYQATTRDPSLGGLVSHIKHHLESGISKAFPQPSCDPSIHSVLHPEFISKSDPFEESPLAVIRPSPVPDLVGSEPLRERGFVGNCCRVRQDEPPQKKKKKKDRKKKPAEKDPVPSVGAENRELVVHEESSRGNAALTDGGSSSFPIVPLERGRREPSLDRGSDGRDHSKTSEGRREAGSDGSMNYVVELYDTAFKLKNAEMLVRVKDSAVNRKTSEFKVVIEKAEAEHSRLLAGKKAQKAKFTEKFGELKGKFKTAGEKK